MHVGPHLTHFHTCVVYYSTRRVITTHCKGWKLGQLDGFSVSELMWSTIICLTVSMLLEPTNSEAHQSQRQLVYQTPYFLGTVVDCTQADSCKKNTSYLQKPFLFTHQQLCYCILRDLGHWA